MVTTKTTEQLTRAVEGWVNSRFTHLFIDGIPGTGKSTVVKNLLPPTGIMIPSSSPLELYKQLVLANSKGVTHAVIDDMDVKLFKGGRSADMLKQLLDPSPERKVSWKSNRTGRTGVPDEFTTKMKVCIITNYISTQNEHVVAIMDRCFSVTHLMSGEEAYKSAKAFKLVSAGFLDKLKAIAPNPTYLSLRQIQNMYYTYKLDMDWEEEFNEYLKHMAGLS